MKKTLYSLMLSDDVVREIDALAHRRGKSRSALIDEILADYVEVMTPERWVRDVFASVEALLAPDRDLVPFVTQGARAMSMKSSLAYKYRPTVKYEVDFSQSEDHGSGALSVIFRTQSEALIRDMTAFFGLWKQLEDAYLPQRGEPPRQYALYDGRFVRSLRLPGDLSGSDAAAAITDYVRTLDRLLKASLAGALSPRELWEEYKSAMERQTIIL